MLVNTHKELPFLTTAYTESDVYIAHTSKSAVHIFNTILEKTMSLLYERK